VGLHAEDGRKKRSRSKKKTKMRLGLILLFGSVLLAFGAQESRLQPDISFSDKVTWQPQFRGVDYAEMVLGKPRPMRGHMVRIHLKDPGIQFVVTPDNGERPDETDGLRTSSFLRQMNCQVAINAAPFAPIHKTEGQPQRVLGLQVNEGKVVSKRESDLPALVLDEQNRATVAKPPFELDRIHHAVGGFSVILRTGDIVARGEAIHPRTAAGISEGGRFLYLLVIDGRQPGYSEGATTAEVAAWLQYLGAVDGINLDGGGTSTLVFGGEDGSAKIVNRPIHAGQPGRERVAGSHLGVRAVSLE
jgi:hypothetical protein